MRKTWLVLLLLVALPFQVGAASPFGDRFQPIGEKSSERMVVVVTASRFPQVLEDVPVSVEVIDRERIERAGANTLSDALRLAGGIVVNDKGGRGADQTAFVRGSTSTQVLILVDGTPVASPQGAFTLTHIPAGIIERIEIVKGPGSALYGADAMGGVINVITQSPTAMEDGAHLTIKGGSRDVEFSASAVGSVGDARFGFNAGYIDSKGFRPNTDYQENHFRLRFDREFSPVSEGYVQFSWLSGQGGAPDPVNTPYPPLNARQRDAQARTELVYTKDFSDGQINSILYGRTYERDYEDSHHRTVTIGGEFQRDLELESGQITVGVAVRTDRANSTDLEGEMISATSAAFFGQWMTEVGDNIALSAGLWIDSHSSYQAPVSPRIGVRAQLQPGIVLRVSAGRAFRAPTFDDLYWKESLWDAGNPDLQPEDGWSYEVGVRHDRSRATVDVALFQRSIENLISWTEGSDGKWRPSNVADSQTSGIELDVSIPLSSNVGLNTHWTWLDARDVQTDAKLPWVPSLEGSFSVQFSRGPVNAYGSVRYRGERPTGGADDMPAYWVLDARASRSIGSDAEIFVEGKNLLDQAYEEAAGYPLPGRTIILGASYRF